MHELSRSALFYKSILTFLDACFVRHVTESVAAIVKLHDYKLNSKAEAGRHASQVLKFKPSMLFNAFQGECHGSLGLERLEQPVQRHCA